ncbi:MAG: hypothetical protein WBU20_22525 [Candidatus Acidiferrum sp.]
MRMDRLSTWDEVRCALSRPIRSGAQPFFTCGTKFAIVPEFSDLVGILAEEAAWFALASKTLDPTWN